MADRRTTRTTTAGTTIAKISVAVDSAGSLVGEGGVSEGVGEGEGEGEGEAVVGSSLQVGILGTKIKKKWYGSTSEIIIYMITVSGFSGNGFKTA